MTDDIIDLQYCMCASSVKSVTMVYGLWKAQRLTEFSGFPSNECFIQIVPLLNHVILLAVTWSVQQRQKRVSEKCLKLPPGLRCKPRKKRKGDAYYSNAVFINR